MLSTIGRFAHGRILTSCTKSTNQALYSLWTPQRVDFSKSGNKKFVDSILIFSGSRSYATSTPAIAVRKETAKQGTKTKSTKKTSPVKPIKTGQKNFREQIDQKPVKKVKKKPVKKVKKKPVKKARKKSLKKVKALTDQDKLKMKLKILKVRALRKPTSLLISGRQIYVAEQLKGSGKGTLGVMAAANAEWKFLSPADVERYNDIAKSNKATNEVALKKWVESYTPDQIREANNARIQLRKKDPKKRSWSQIRDPRQPKRPSSAYLIYTKARFNSGEFKGVPVTQAIKSIHEEFKALSSSERKKYDDLSESDRARYTEEQKAAQDRESNAARS